MRHFCTRCCCALPRIPTLPLNLRREEGAWRGMGLGWEELSDSAGSSLGTFSCLALLSLHPPVRAAHMPCLASLPLCALPVLPLPFASHARLAGCAACLWPATAFPLYLLKHLHAILY